MAMGKHKWLLFIPISLVLFQSYCLSAASSMIVSSSADDWTMFRHDPSHCGYATGNSSASSIKPLWTYTTGRMVQSSPAVANGCVFVGCRDSSVYCLNSSSGEPVWKLPIKYEVWSSPAIYNARVYVGADDGYVYCLNKTTGTTIWKSKIGGAVRSSPTVADDRVYVGSGGHDVFCLNASDGDTIWSYPTEYRVYSSPAVSDGVVYVVTEDYSVCALNASTGGEKWRTPTGRFISVPSVYSVTSSASVYDGYVYVGSFNGYVYGLNSSTGAKIWQYQTEGSVSSSPAVAYGCVYIGSDDNNVYCLNARDGKIIWQSPTGYWVRSSPAVTDGNVYVGSEDYNLYCLDAFTGARKWSYATENFVESSPAIANGNLYVGSDDSRIYAFALGESPDSLPQSTICLPWTTIAFDAIACAVAAVIIFTITRFFYSNKSIRQNAEAMKVSSRNLSWFSLHADAVCILAILAFSTIFFINLGSEPLWAADEQTYSQWAFHMVRNGDYLTPWAYGDVTFWIGKPPLFIWLMALSYQVFGVNNFASRLWSPIFGMLSLVLVFYLGKKFYNWFVGFLSAIVLGTFLTFYVLARHAMTDVPFVFFMLGSIYFLLLSEESEGANRYAVLGGLFFGLAFMTKQVAAFLIPLIVFVYFAAAGRGIRFFFTRRFTLFWGIGLLVVSPWLVYMVLLFGQEFWQYYFVYSAITRTVSPIEGHGGGYLFYFSYLVSRENVVWVILLPFAASFCAFNAIVKRLNGDILILAWISTVLAVFTFAQTKLEWYILPAFPAFAIAIGNFLYKLSKKCISSEKRVTKGFLSRFSRICATNEHKRLNPNAS